MKREIMNNLLKSVLTVGSVVFATYIGNTLSKSHNPEIQVTTTNPTKSLSPDSKVKLTKKIVRLSPPSNRVVYLDSVVNEESSTNVIKKLKDLDTSTEPVFLLINSP